MENSNNPAGSSKRERVDYDPNLPPKHAYLSRDFTDIQGRILYDDDEIVDIPLLFFASVVLFPGQKTPLQIRDPKVIEMMMEMIKAERTFGLIVSSAEVGTTVEIRSYSIDQRNPNEPILKIITEGRQRFTLLDRWREDSIFIYGKVQILGENDPTSPYDRNNDFNSKGNRFNSKLAPSVTPWPSFVFQMYDADYLIKMINEKIKNYANFSKSNPKGCLKSERWAATIVGANEKVDYDNDDFIESSDKVKTDQEVGKMSACQYSFWLAANLTINYEHRVELINIPTTVGRLRYLYSLLHKRLYICCKKCVAPLSSREDMLCVSIEGPLQNYINPGGYVHETITVRRAYGLTLTGMSTPQASWFPGYSWTICECKACGHHVGWKFTSVIATKPKKFWAISRISIEPRFA